MIVAACRRKNAVTWCPRAVVPGRARDGAAPGGGGRRDPNTQAYQLALDALVAPARVLPGQAHDQLLYLMVQRRPVCLAVRVGPGASHEPPMPAQQRLGCDKEA
jgi:hypothetical protein